MELPGLDLEFLVHYVEEKQFLVNSLVFWFG